MAKSKRKAARENKRNGIEMTRTYSPDKLRKEKERKGKRK